MSLILIGDICTINVDKESRSWGNGLPPNGTEVEVVGYEEIDYGYTDNFGRDPGIYENRSWLKVKGLDYSISSCFLDLPKVVQAKRVKECQDWHAHSRSSSGHGAPYETQRVRLLPETPFWPGDMVELKVKHPSFDQKTVFVYKIHYYDLTRKTNNGSPWPAYDITPDWPGGSWTSPRTENELSLLQRGNVWKHYHEEKIDFPGGLVEEASFAALLGHSWDVRNPKTEVFVWDLDEALEAIQSGLGDSLEIRRGSFFSNRHSYSHRVYKYRNEELGKRIANTTLQGFNRPLRGSK